MHNQSPNRAIIVATNKSAGFELPVFFLFFPLYLVCFKLNASPCEALMRVHVKRGLYNSTETSFNSECSRVSTFLIQHQPLY